jgi:hypothetical protein
MIVDDFYMTSFTINFSIKMETSPFFYLFSAFTYSEYVEGEHSPSSEEDHTLDSPSHPSEGSHTSKPSLGYDCHHTMTSHKAPSQYPYMPPLFQEASLPHQRALYIGKVGDAALHW